MIRRLFTLIVVCAFVLLFIVRMMGEGDPRYSLFGIGFVLHPENRMAIRPASGRTWAFNYSPLYLPLTACFLAAAIWNWAVWRRKRPELMLLLSAGLSGAIALVFLVLCIEFPRVPGPGFGLLLSLASIYVLAHVHRARRTAALRAARDLRHCRQCHYDLTGNVSGTCPECGTAIAPRS